MDQDTEYDAGGDVDYRDDDDIEYTETTAQFRGPGDLAYKCNCTFDVHEGQVHVYNCTGGIGPNSFTKSELMSVYLSHIVTQFQIPREGHRELVRFMNTLIRDYDEFIKEPGAKILHGDVVDDLMKSKSSIIPAFIARQADIKIKTPRFQNRQ
ncbi:hypothetical protein BC941DRAFT_458133 [Chlamydoabsidia padenii]|nr:hypothetical protein BC941DRAFT_458133 [Chlamydoabsidia padenii]